MTKQMRTGKYALDDYEGQSREVARQKGTGLFMVRIDHCLRRDFIKLALKLCVQAM